MPITFREDDWGPTQWKWLWSRSPYSLLAAGQGAGKTAAGRGKILKLKGDNGRMPGLVIAQTYGALYENIVDPLLELCDEIFPHSKVPKLIGRNGPRAHLLFPDNSKVHLRSAEIPKGYNGLNVAWLYGDEIRYWSKEAYRVAISRVRLRSARNPQRCFTSTPEMHWMADEFNTGKPRRECLSCSTHENEKNLDPDYIEDMRLSYSPRVWDALIRGLFVLLEGAVYDILPADIENSPWVVDYQYNPHNKTYLAVDPGRRSSWLFVQQVGRYEWVVFDELQGEGESDWAMVQKVNSKGYGIDEIWTDPAAEATHSELNLDTITMLRDVVARSEGPIRHITGRFRSVKFGVDKMRTLLGDPASNLPIRWKFAKKLLEIEEHQERGIVRSMRRYAYPAHKPGHGYPSEPLKDGVVDHDCLSAGTMVETASGPVPIEKLSGIVNVNTPVGTRKAFGAMVGRKQLYRLHFANGGHVDATGDHMFLVDASGYACKKPDHGKPTDTFGYGPTVQWQSVLAMREILQQADEPGKGIPSPGRVDLVKWRDSENARHTPQEQESTRQQAGEPGDHRSGEALEPAHEHPSREGKVVEGHEARTRSGEGVAWVGGWEGVAQETREGGCGTTGKETSAKEGLHCMREGVHLSPSASGKVEILPPQLQDDRSSSEAGYQTERVISIEELEEADTYCLYVPQIHAFNLSSGIISHNCDGARYLAVGLWLTSGLMEFDSKMREMAKKTKGAGYKIAA